MRRIFSLALSATLLLALLSACGGAPQAGQATASPPPPSPAAPTDTAPPQAGPEGGQSGGGLHHVELVIQGYDPIRMELDGDAAPITVEHFLALADSGFYEGRTFHRIMEGFMMQGGADTEGTVEAIQGEFAANGVDNPISHTRGAVSMARTYIPDSATSQFFIVHQDSTFLDGQYAAFGRVTEGMEVVDAICAAAQPVDDNGTIPAEEQPVIASMTVLD